MNWLKRGTPFQRLMKAEIPASEAYGLTLATMSKLLDDERLHNGELRQQVAAYTGSLLDRFSERNEFDEIAVRTQPDEQAVIPMAAALLGERSRMNLSDIGFAAVMEGSTEPPATTVSIESAHVVWSEMAVIHDQLANRR